MHARALHITRKWSRNAQDHTQCWSQTEHDDTDDAPTLLADLKHSRPVAMDTHLSHASQHQIYANNACSRMHIRQNLFHMPYTHTHTTSEPYMLPEHIHFCKSSPPDNDTYLQHTTHNTQPMHRSNCKQDKEDDTLPHQCKTCTFSSPLQFIGTTTASPDFVEKAQHPLCIVIAPLRRVFKHIQQPRSHQ